MSPRGTVNGQRAAVLARDSAYRMFKVRDLSTEGAFLIGNLLLEVDEEFDMELSFAGDPVRLRARVVAVEWGERPGMNVTFTRVSQQAMKKLERKTYG